MTINYITIGIEIIIKHCKIEQRLFKYQLVYTIILLVFFLMGL